jgi:hypothetical protein
MKGSSNNKKKEKYNYPTATLAGIGGGVCLMSFTFSGNLA